MTCYNCEARQLADDAAQVRSCAAYVRRVAWCACSWVGAPRTCICCSCERKRFLESGSASRPPPCPAHIHNHTRCHRQFELQSTNRMIASLRRTKKSEQATGQHRGCGAGRAGALHATKAGYSWGLPSCRAAPRLQTGRASWKGLARPTRRCCHPGSSLLSSLQSPAWQRRHMNPT